MAKIITDVLSECDEKGAGGLWDLAAEIALRVGLLLQKDEDEVVYAEDYGQDLIYYTLLEYV